MSFDWEKYIELAENLASVNDEARLRTAISRAYYGVFCLSRNKKGLKNDRESNIHSKVISSYKSSNDEKEKSIGRYLDELRKHRNEADYNDEKEITIDIAERVILKAQEILYMLKYNT